MTAIIATEGLGLFNSSKQTLGTAGLGFGGAGDQLHVNAVNGNLVVQRQDQVLVGHGVDTSLVRTYNSQAGFNDNDGDSSRFNFQQKVVQSGDQLTRWTETGSEQTFTLASGNTYVSDDIGVDDSITKVGDQWVYQNPETQVTYEFNAEGANLGKLSRMVNGEGLALTYTHTDTSVTITDPAGQTTEITLTAGKVTAIKQTDKDGVVLSSIGYEYTDTTNPDVLTKVSVDLTPQKTGDNRYYVTQYTYEPRNGSPLLISVRQGESNNTEKTLGQNQGSVVSFVYDNGVDGLSTEPRIAQLIQGEGEKASVTEYVYGENKTDVITYQRFRVEVDANAPLGQRYIAERTSTTTHHYIERIVENGTNQRMISKVESAANDSGFRAVTVFGYTDQGDVRFVQDAEGNVTRYGYDYDSDSVVATSEGLRLWQMDGEGNAIRWYYNNDNQVISEVRYTDPDLNPSDAIFAASGDEVTRFVYDSDKRLAFSINPAGQVSGTEYTGINAVDNTRSVTQTLYSTNLLTDTSQEAINAQNAMSVVSDTIDVALLNTWANNQNGNTQYSISHLDYRGQISQTVTTYTALNLDDNSTTNNTTSTTHFVYDHQGRLVQQVAPNADSNDSTQATHYVYDGLGRLVATALVENVQDDGSADLINNDALSIEQITSLPGFNQVTTYTQDTKTGGQHTRTEFANGFIQEQVFDRAGRLVSQHEADGKFTLDDTDDIDLGTTEFIYDAQGRLRITQDAEGVLTHSVYNDRNQVVATIDGNGALTELSYDNAGQVTRVIQYANYLTISQLSRLSANNGDSVRALDVSLESVRPSFSNDDRITHNLYDDANRLIYSIDGEGYVTEIQYDGKGQITNTLKHSTPYPGFTPLNDSDITISRPSLADVSAFAQYNYATAEHFTVDTKTWIQGTHSTTDVDYSVGLESQRHLLDALGITDFAGHGYSYQTLGETDSALNNSVVSAIDLPSTRELDFSQSIEALGFYGIASDVIGFHGSTLQYLETNNNQLLLRPVNQVLVGDGSYNSWDEITYHRNQYYAANRDFSFSFKAQDLVGRSDYKHDFVGISDGNGNQWGVRFSGRYTFAATTAYGETGLHSFGTRDFGTTAQVEIEVKDNIAYMWVYDAGTSRPDISQAAQLDLSTWGDFDALHTTLEMEGTSTQQLAITEWIETGVAIDGPSEGVYYHNDFTDKESNYGFSGYTIGEVDNAAVNSSTGSYFSVTESFNVTQLDELDGANVMRVTTVDTTENVAYRELIGTKRYLLDDSTRTVVRYEFTGGVNSSTFRGFMGITDELGNRFGIKLLRNDVYSSSGVYGNDFGQITSNRSLDIGTIYVAEIEVSGGEYHIYYYPKPNNEAASDAILDHKSERILVDHGELPDTMGSRLSSYVQAYGNDNWYYNDKNFYITKMEEWGTEDQWIAEKFEDGNIITEGGLSYNQFFDLSDSTADNYLANLQDIESIKTTLTRIDVETHSQTTTESIDTIFNPNNYDGRLTLLADGTLADGRYQINSTVIYNTASGIANKTYTETVVQGSYQARTEAIQGEAIDNFFSFANTEPKPDYYLDILNTQQISAELTHRATNITSTAITDLTYKSLYNGYLILTDTTLDDGVYDVVVTTTDLNGVETKHPAFTLQQGDRYNYDHKLTFDFDNITSDAGDDATFSGVKQDSISLTYWKEDGGEGEPEVITYSAAPASGDSTVAHKGTIETQSIFEATLTSLEQGEYGYTLTYEQVTGEQSSISGNFISDPVLTVTDAYQQQAAIEAEHHYTIGGTEVSSNGRSISDYLSLPSTDGGPLAFFGVANAPAKENIETLFATIRYAGTEIVISTATTDRTQWLNNPTYENILLLTDGTPLSAGEYDVSVQAKVLGSETLVNLHGFTLQVSDQLDASSTQSQGAQLTWEGVDAEQLELRFGQSNAGTNEAANYTKVVLEQTNNNGIPTVTVYDMTENNESYATSPQGASLTGLLGQYNTLAVTELTTQAQDIQNVQNTNLLINAGLEDAITQAYSDVAIDVTQRHSLTSSYQASHGVSWDQYSRTVNLTEPNNGLTISDNKRVIADAGGIRLIHDDTTLPDTWVSVAGTVEYDNSASTATVAKQTRATYQFNSGRMDYTGFLGFEGQTTNGSTEYVGLSIRDNQAHTLTRSLNADTNLATLKANTDYTVTITLKGSYTSIELQETNNNAVSASYSDPSAVSLINSQSYMAVKGDGEQFGNSLLVTGLTESGEQVNTTTTLEYRREGETEWQQATVTQEEGVYDVQIGGKTVEGNHVDAWEYRINEQQNGATLRSVANVVAAVETTANGVSVETTETLQAQVKREQLNATQGSRINGYLNTAQMTGLDYAVTTITNADGVVVDTVTTWANLDDNYNGYINIADNTPLAEGQYQLSIALIKDGAINQTIAADYQRDNQTTVTQQLTWQVDGGIPADSVVELRIRPLGSDEEHQEISITETVVDANTQYQATFVGAPNSQWEFVVLEKSKTQGTILSARKGELTFGEKTGTSLDHYLSIQDANTVSHIVAEVKNQNGDTVSTAITQLDAIIGYTGKVYLSESETLEDGNYDIVLTTHFVAGSVPASTTTTLNDFMVGDKKNSQHVADSITNNIDPSHGDNEPKVVLEDIGSHYVIRYLDAASTQENTIINTIEIAKGLDTNTLTIEQLNDSQYAYGIEYKDAAGQLYSQMDGAFIANHLGTPTSVELAQFYGQSVAEMVHSVVTIDQVESGVTPVKSGYQANEVLKLSETIGAHKVSLTLADYNILSPDTLHWINLTGEGAHERQITLMLGGDYPWDVVTGAPPAMAVGSGWQNLSDFDMALKSESTLIVPVFNYPDAIASLNTSQQERRDFYTFESDEALSLEAYLDLNYGTRREGTTGHFENQAYSVPMESWGDFIPGDIVFPLEAYGGFSFAKTTGLTAEILTNMGLDFLYLYDETRVYTPEQIEIMETFSDQEYVSPEFSNQTGFHYVYDEIKKAELIQEHPYSDNKTLSEYKSFMAENLPAYNSLVDLYAGEYKIYSTDHFNIYDGAGNWWEHPEAWRQRLTDVGSYEIGYSVTIELKSEDVETLEALGADSIEARYFYRGEEHVTPIGSVSGLKFKIDHQYIDFGGDIEYALVALDARGKEIGRLGSVADPLTFATDSADASKITDELSVTAKKLTLENVDTGIVTNGATIDIPSSKLPNAYSHVAVEIWDVLDQVWVTQRIPDNDDFASSVLNPGGENFLQDPTITDVLMMDGWGDNVVDKNYNANLLTDAQYDQLLSDPNLSKYVDASGGLANGREYSVKVSLYGLDNLHKEDLILEVDLREVTLPKKTPSLLWENPNLPDTTEVWIRYAIDGNYSDVNQGWQSDVAFVNADGLMEAKLFGLSKNESDILPEETTGDYEFEILYVDSLTYKEISSATGVFNIDYDGTSPVTLDIEFTRSVDGREARTFYDVNGQVHAALAADGAVTQFIYNGLNQRVDTVQYEALVPEALRANGSLTDILDTVNESETLHNISMYDERGAVVATVNAEGFVTLFEYNQNNQQTATKILQRQLTETYRTKLFANPIAESSITMLLSYNSTDGGALIFDAAKFGANATDQLSQVGYTLRGEVDHTITTDGTRTDIDYDLMGQVIATQTDARNIIQDRDIQGQVKEERRIGDDGSEQRIVHAYDNNGLRTSTTVHSEGESGQTTRTTRFFYDANGRLTFSINANDELAETLYNAFGEVIGSQTYAARLNDLAVNTSQIQGGITSGVLLQYFRSLRTESDNRNHLRYDRRGLVRLQADALGHQQRFEYNAFAERTRSIRDAKGGTLDGQSIITETFYDKRGRAESTTEDAQGVRRISAISYDSFGRITDQIDGNGNHTSFSLDKIGRQTHIAQLDKEGGILTQAMTTYDALGRVLTQSDGVATTQYVYNDENRNVAIKINTGAETLTETTISNAHGETRLVEQANGDRTIYDYNDLGELIAVYNNTEALRNFTSFSESAIQGYIDAVQADEAQKADSVNAYYQSGLLKIATDVNGTEVFYEYDAGQRLIRKTVDNTVDSSGLNLVTDYQYDAQGRQVSEIQWLVAPGENEVATPSNAIITVTEYDVAGRVTSVTNKGVIPGNDPELEGKNDVITAFTYDDLGNQLTVSAGGAPAVKYDVDDNNQLTRVYVAPASSTRYEYDSLGRRVAEIVDSSYIDAETNQQLYQGLDLTTRYVYDDNNNVIKSINANGAETLFYYDEADREVYRVNGEGDVSETLYNTQGLVIAKRQYAQPIDTYHLQYGKEKVIRSVSTRDDVIAMLQLADATDQSAIMAEHPTVQYVYDDTGRLIYTLDALGQVTQNIYDRAGRVIQTRQFDIKEYGAANAATLSTQLVAESFTGNNAVNHVAALIDSSISAAHIQQTVYDTLGRAWIQVNALGQVTENQYDRAGRLLVQIQFADAVTGFDHNTTQSELEAFIKTQRIADIASQIRAYERNTQESTTNRYTWFTYDAVGRQHTQLDSLGYMNESVYDAAGRVVHNRRYSEAHTLAYLFKGDSLNPNGEVLNNLSESSFTSRLNNIITALEAFSLAELETATLASANDVLMPWANELAGTYQDWLTAVNEIAHGDTSTAYANHANYLQQTTTEYDNAGRVIAIIDAEANSKSNHPTEKETYEYDAAGNRTVLTNKNEISWTSVYDNANRLVREITPSVAQMELAGVLSSMDFATADASFDTSSLTADYGVSNGSGVRLYNNGATSETAQISLDDATSDIWEMTLSFSKEVLATQPTVFYTGTNDQNDSRGIKLELGADSTTVSYYNDDTQLITQPLTDSNGDAITLDGDVNYVMRFEVERTYNAEPSTVSLEIYELNASTRSYVASVQYESDWDASTNSSENSTANLGVTLNAATANTQSVVIYSIENVIEDVRWAQWATETRSIETVSPIVTTYAYDGLGNVVQMVEGAGTLSERVTGFIYDDVGRQRTTIHPSVSVYDETEDIGDMNGLGVDPYANEIRTEDSRAPSETTYFDSLGNEIAHIDGRDVKTFKVYDAANRLAYEVDGEGYVTGYAYDGFNNIETLTRYAAALDFDAVGMAEVPEDHRFGMTLAQLLNGLSTDATNDRELTTHYDALNRKISVVQPAVDMLINSETTLTTKTPITGTEYDDFGQVIEEWRMSVDNEGADLKISTYHRYDHAGNRIATLDSENYLTTLVYDKEGNVTERTEYAEKYTGTATDFMASWIFNYQAITQASASELRDDDTLLSDIGYDREYRYTYDVMNRRVSETQLNVFVDSVVFGPQVNNTQTSDLTRTFASSVLISETGYDALGNVVALTTTKDGTVDTKVTTQTFYDVLGRVSAIVEPEILSATQDSSEQLVITHSGKDTGDAQLEWRTPQLAGIDTEKVTFVYRKVGDEAWNELTAQVGEITTTVSVAGLSSDRYEYQVNYTRLGDTEKYGVARGEIDIITGTQTSPSNSVSWIEQNSTEVKVHVITATTAANLRLVVNGADVPVVTLASDNPNHHVFTISAGDAENGLIFARGGYQFLVQDISDNNAVLTRGQYQITQANGEEDKQVAFSFVNSTYDVNSKIKNQMWFHGKKDKWRHLNKFSVDWSSTKQLGDGELSWSITVETSNAYGNRHKATFSSSKMVNGTWPYSPTPAQSGKSVPAPGYGVGTVHFGQNGLSYSNTHDRTSSGRSARIEGVLAMTVWKEVDGVKIKVIDTRRDKINTGKTWGAEINKLELLNVNVAGEPKPEALTLRYRIPQNTEDGQLETSTGVVIDTYESLWQTIEVRKNSDNTYWANRDGIPAGQYEFELLNGDDLVNSSATHGLMVIGGGVDSQAQIAAGTGQFVAPMTAFAYDAVGNRIQQTQFSGGANRAMLAEGKLVADKVVANIDVEKDQVNRWRYDMAGNRIQQINGEHDTVFFAYDEKGSLRKEWTMTKDYNGYRQTQGQVFRYNGVGQQTHTIQLRPTLDQNYTQLEDAEKLVVTETRYNAFGELVERGLVKSDVLFDNTLEPTTLNEYFDYNDIGQLVKTNQDNGVDRFYYYNRLGQMVQQVAESGIGWTLNAANDTQADFNDKTAQDALNLTDTVRKTHYQYDNLGRTQQVIAPEFTTGTPGAFITYAQLTTQKVDRWGNVIELVEGDRDGVVGQNGIESWTTTYQYNQQNKAIYEQKLKGEQLNLWQQTGDAVNGEQVIAQQAITIDNHFYVDLQGRQLGSVDANENSQATLYNNRGLAEKLVAADGGISRNGYDALGQRREATNEIGHSHFYRYDKAGRMSNHYTASGGETRYEYDNAGNRVLTRQLIRGTASANDQQWLETHQRYNALGKAVETIVGDLNGLSQADRTRTTMYYDERGNQSAAVLVDGGVAKFDYDYFGRMQHKRDYGGIDTQFVYDQAGQLRRQYQLQERNTYRTGSETADLNYGYTSNVQDIRYEYLANGLVGVKDDLGVGLHTSYVYDQKGRQIREVNVGESYQLATVNLPTLKYRTIWNPISEMFESKGFQFTAERSLKVTTEITTDTKYDRLGRIQSVNSISHADPVTILRNGEWLTTPVEELTDYGINLTYEYDAVGNRRHVSDGVAEDELWYSYDKNNRLLATQGARVIDGTESRVGLHATNERSALLSYDLAGNRIKSERAGGDLEKYIYDADNRHVATTVTDSANAGNTYVSQKHYDKMGRATYQFNYNYQSADEDNNSTAVGDPKELIAYTYQGDGQLAGQIAYGYTDAGLPQVHTASDKALWSYVSNDGTIDTSNLKKSYKVDFSYTGYDSIKTQTTTGYDSNGTTVSYTDKITNSYIGFDSFKVISRAGRRQSDLSKYKPGTTTQYYDANGNVIALRDHQKAANNRDFYLNSQGEIIRKRNLDGATKTQYYYYSNGKGIASDGQLEDKDLDYNFTPISDNYPSPTPSAYTVQSTNESLETVAAQIWGDSSLWYLIADANGLTASGGLTVGQILTIPNNVTNVQNTSETFKPYNASQIIGDTTPTMPIAPPPKEDGGAGCSAAQILVIIIVIIVIIWTAGAASSAAGVGAGAGGGTAAGGTATASAGGAVAGGTATGLTTMELGVAVLAGEYGTATAIGAGLVAGAAGNAVGQVAGMALGIRDEFSWNEVAVGAASTAVGGALSGITTVAGSEALGLMLQQTLSYTANYGINKAAGMDVTFRWSDVAASVVAAGATKAIGRIDTKDVGLQTFQDAARATASGMLERKLNKLFGHGGKQTNAEIAMNAFGQAIGDSIVGKTQRSYAIEFKEQRAAEQRVTMGDAKGVGTGVNEMVGPPLPPELLAQRNFVGPQVLADLLAQRNRESAEQRQWSQNQSAKLGGLISDIDNTLDYELGSGGGFNEFRRGQVLADRQGQWDQAMSDAGNRVVGKQQQAEFDALVNAGLEGPWRPGAVPIQFGASDVPFAGDSPSVFQIEGGNIYYADGGRRDLVNGGVPLSGLEKFGNYLDSKQLGGATRTLFPALNALAVVGGVLDDGMRLLHNERLLPYMAAPATAPIAILPGLLTKMTAPLKSLPGMKGASNGNVLARETGNPIIDLMFGRKVGEGLPGSQGVKIANRPTVLELENLSAKHNVEFSVTYSLGKGRNGGGGQYYLRSGTINSVNVPIKPDSIWISHTHPGGTAIASGADQKVLKALQAVGSRQKSSQVIPLGKPPIRFNLANKSITQ
ncbi:hypothetical protein A9Q81_07695 [Gammaproteobacteria bacterium 42_54_T18]|nr:hypothetical protein A9Q81_07695 [Gammaproteobacteria bacterium 42_54_T18]